MDNKRAHDLACSIIANPELFKEFKASYINEKESFSISEIRISEDNKSDKNNFVEMYKNLVRWIEEEKY